MVHIEKVDGKNVWNILALHVNEEQKTFVAGNDRSIIEAYIAITSGGHAYPFGIYKDDIVVGFLMLGYGSDEDWGNPPRIVHNNYNVWRFMIDEKYQKNGYGKEALKLALDYIKTEPCGKAEYCWLSYEPENIVAKKLYNSFGFYETGEIYEGEMIAVLKLG